MKILLLKMRVDSIFNRAKTLCNVLRTTYILAIATLIFSSCGKELNDPVSNSITSVSSDSSRKSLTVNAGPGRKVVYPDDNSTKLFGSGGGESIDYKWEQIS